MIAMVMGFAILAAFALGLVIGRIWQIRSDELHRRASFTLPTHRRHSASKRRQILARSLRIDSASVGGPVPHLYRYLANVRYRGLRPM